MADEVSLTAPPPSASSRFASANCFSSFRRSSRMAASRSIISSGADLQKFRRLAHARILRGEIRARALARERLDAAHAGGDRAFADDLEQADIAGAAHMGAAAQLDRIGVLRLGARLALAHADDADLFAVFLAEQRQRALGDRLVGTHQMRLHR